MRAKLLVRAAYSRPHLQQRLSRRVDAEEDARRWLGVVESFAIRRIDRLLLSSSFCNTAM